jgi:hypothetical protein
MATPSPLGIIYLLLEMLKQLLDQLPPSEENVDATATVDKGMLRKKMVVSLFKGRCKRCHQA